MHFQCLICWTLLMTIINSFYHSPWSSSLQLITKFNHKLWLCQASLDLPSRLEDIYIIPIVASIYYIKIQSTKQPSILSWFILVLIPADSQVLTIFSFSSWLSWKVKAFRVRKHLWSERSHLKEQAYKNRAYSTGVK